MTSLLRQLFDTMPLSGVCGAIRKSQGHDFIENAPAGVVANHISYLDTSEALGLEITCGAPSKTLRDGAPELVPLWSWKQDGLNGVAKVGCRPRDDDFKQYLVLDRAVWGVEEGDGLEPAIEIELAGVSTKLPLTEPYHLLSFLVEDGYNAPKQNWFYPLEACHDPSVVHAFVYDVLPTPRQMMALADPAHPQAEEVEALRSLCRQIFPLSKENLELGPMAKEVFLDALWPEPYDFHDPSVLLGQLLTLQVRAVRVLVAVCLTTCREDWRFTPGAAAGMARIYPQIFVKSNAPLARIAATMHIDRPAKMTILDPPAEEAGCHEMKNAMGSLMIADANDGMENMLGTVPLYNEEQPYWSNLFAYTLPDAYSKTKGAVLKVVNDKKTPRQASGLVYRYPVRTYGGAIGGLIEALASDPKKPSTLVKRVPRQGPFDNFHLAPRMAMNLGSKPTVALASPSPDIWDNWERYPIDPATWGTNEVVMAPFCAHDCFHMHWRWSDLSPDYWTWGWSDRGPYTKNGAVMVPSNHDLEIKMRSEHQVTYRACARDVPINKNTVFCHHGGAYALTIGPPLGVTNLPLLHQKATVRTAATGVENNTIPIVAFADADGKFLRAGSSWAVFYWQLRWDIVMEAGGPTPRERVQINDPYLKDLKDL